MRQRRPTISAPLLWACCLFLFLGTAQALEYTVITSDTAASSELSSQMREAFNQWRAVGSANFEAEEVPNSNTRIDYSSRLGPDTASITASRRQGRLRQVTVLFSQSSAFGVTARLHEAGILLGLDPQLTSDGVMNPVLSGASPNTLSTRDRDTLLSRNSFAAEDVNRDGFIDFYDLAELARNYNQGGVVLAADINQDGVVNFDDLTRLQDAYVFDTPSATPPLPPAERALQASQKTVEEADVVGDAVQDVAQDALEVAQDVIDVISEDLPEETEPGTAEEEQPFSDSDIPSPSENLEGFLDRLR